MRNLRRLALEELVGDQEYSIKRLDDIIETIMQVFDGYMNSSNIYDKEEKDLSMESLERLSSKRIGAIAKDLGIIDSRFDFSTFSNKEFRMLIYTIEAELDKHISEYLYKYSPELFITNMMFFASIISKVTMEANSEEEIEFDFNDEILSIERTLQSIRKTASQDIRPFLREIKAATEYSINYVLLSTFTMSDVSRTKKMDYLEILVLFNAKNYLFQLRELIPLLKDRRGELSINEEGIMIPNYFVDGFNKYAELTMNEKIRVENNLTNKLFEVFRKIMEFEPENIIKYILSQDENRALKIYNNFLSIVDKNLLRMDIMLNQKLTFSGGNKIIECFTLNDKNFYKSKSATELTESKNDRLFIAPIIEVEDKLILPTYSWLESIHYFSFRILNRDINIKNIDHHNWNELIKTTYDEYDIQELKSLLEYHGYIAGKNWDLSQDKELKDLIESVKGMPHEVDLYYIKDNMLMIHDLKNYGMQFSFSDAKKLVDSVRIEKKKLRKLKKFIMDRKDFFERRLGFPFADVSLGIITVDPTIYNFFVEKEDEVSVKSIAEFRKILST
jgi:hypothetical protein